MVTFDFAFVHPNEFDKEKKYIEANIKSTKKAYSIDCDMENINYLEKIVNSLNNQKKDY